MPAQVYSGWPVITGYDPTGTQQIAAEMVLGAGQNQGILKTRPDYGPSRLTLLASAAQSAGSNGVLVDVSKFKELIIFLNCTAMSGTTPSLTVYIDASPDGGTTWAQVASFTALTAANNNAGLISTAPLQLTNFGDSVRVRWALTGTTPNATFGVFAVGKQ